MKMSAAHIDSLPDEVLENIFSFVRPEHVILYLRFVCQRWRDVAEAQILTKQLVLRSDDIPIEEALCLLSSASKVQSLRLSVCNDTSLLLQAASRHCRKLVRLSVSFCSDIGGSLTAAFCNVFHNCLHITDISITYVNNCNSQELCQELSTALPNLRKLEIRCKWFKSQDLDTLLDGCTVMEEFRAVELQCSGWSISKLAHQWGHSLRVLEICAVNLTDTDLAPLARCSQLQCLTLTHGETSGVGLQHLAALSQLEELDLSWSQTVQPEMWQQFVSRTRSAGCLRKVNLRYCSKLDDSVLSALAAWSKLENLDLLTCFSITAAGVRVVLRSCHQLQYVNLSRTQASVASVIPELPQLAPQLQQIRICYQHKIILGEAALEDVKTQMPHLEVLY